MNLFLDQTVVALLFFGLGYFFKDQIGKGILKESKIFKEGFSLLMLIMVIYVLYRFGIFNPIIGLFRA